MHGTIAITFKNTYLLLKNQRIFCKTKNSYLIFSSFLTENVMFIYFLCVSSISSNLTIVYNFRLNLNHSRTNKEWKKVVTTVIRHSQIYKGICMEYTTVVKCARNHWHVIIVYCTREHGMCNWQGLPTVPFPWTW